MGNGIVWNINGANITGDNLNDIDLTVIVGTDGVSDSQISQVAEECESLQIRLLYDGEFGFTAALTINIGRKYAGVTADLFHYNEQKNTLEFVSSHEVAGDGTVNISLTHASDYVFVFRNMPTEEVSNEGGSSGASWWWIVLIVLIVLIGAGFGGVFLIRKQEDQNE